MAYVAQHWGQPPKAAHVFLHNRRPLLALSVGKEHCVLKSEDDTRMQRSPFMKANHMKAYQSVAESVSALRLNEEIQNQDKDGKSMVVTGKVRVCSCKVLQLTTLRRASKIIRTPLGWTGQQSFLMAAVHVSSEMHSANLIP